MVSDLIFSKTGGWNAEFIEFFFNQRDCDAILKISLILCLGPDVRVWHYTKSGVFMVKSANHLGTYFMADWGSSSPSSSRPVGSVWRSLWKMNVILKVPLIMWKLCINSLPTKVNLNKRIVGESVLCLLCGDPPETKTYLFQQRSYANQSFNLAELNLNTIRKGPHLG